MRKASCWLVLLFTANLLGCTVLPTQPVQVAAPDSSLSDVLPAGEGWWYARFSIARPEGERTRWHIDTLLAGEVIAPVFDRHYGDILIWRIHRRAPQDEYGHVFSFIFYTTAAGAQRIYEDIGNNPVLARLRQEGDVTGVSFDDVGKLTRPGIGDTSDASWLPVVQQTWPALIMGASRMWLDMVTVLASGQPQELDQDERYRAVEKEISRIWAEQGQHAVLHHLSAIYGYKPLLIRY
jgi:hypothetical protein